MSTPSYKTLLENLQDVLQDSLSLSNISDTNIFIGGLTGQIFQWPAITIELAEGASNWRATHQLEDTLSIVIGIYTEYMDYLTGIQAIQDLIKNIQDTLQADRKIGSSSLGVRTTEMGRFRFGLSMYEDTPLFGGELELTVYINYTPNA